MPVTFGTPIVLLMTLMLCLPARLPAPSSSSGAAADAWVAGNDKDKDEYKDKNEQKDDDEDKDDDEAEWNAMGGTTDGVDDAWADRVLANPHYDHGWCQPCRENWQGERRASYCEVREFPMTRAGATIALDGADNGGMTVMGSSRGAARMIYRVIGRARTEERAKEIVQAVKVVNHGGWITSEGPATSRLSHDFWSVEMKVWVPRESNLALKVVNGPLGIRGVRGTMDVQATNGPVSLVDLGGAVVARVENGPLHVQLTGPSWQGKGLDALAQNGPVNLVLPARYSARLQTGTINGPRSTDYALQAGRTRGWITTTLGSGGPPVRVVTENGPYQVTSSR